jgi:signal transduction histidine kinase
VSSINAFFRRLPTWAVLFLGLLLVSLVGIADALAGHTLTLGPLYVLPIALVAWYHDNSRALVAVVTVVAVVRLVVHLVAMPEEGLSAAALLDGFSGLVVYGLVGWSLYALRAARGRQNELINFVVHDLRSPLAVSTTALGLLDDYATGLSESDRSLVRDALAANKRLQALIDAILDTARLEGGKMPLEIGQIDPCGAAERAVEQVKLWAAQRQVSLHLTAEGPLPWGLADAELTTRVLVNLLHNAVKFSPPGSAIQVLIEPVNGAPPELRFEVTDQGPGIAPEWADRIFEKFIQVEAQQAGKPVGAGLGLNFCRLAVEAMGGRIWLAHSSRDGTTICFTLPAVASALPQRLREL